LTETAASLFLNFGTEYSQALKMRRSDVDSIFNSKTFADMKKAAESKQKVWTSLFERLDNITRAVGSLGKLLSRR
jgi:hypothetical protein